MSTHAMLTRLAPEAVKSPADLKQLEAQVAARVRKDYLGLFEAPDAETAAKVVMIVRSFGHGQTETWTALPWERFERLIAAA